MNKEAKVLLTASAPAPHMLTCFSFLSFMDPLEHLAGVAGFFLHLPVHLQHFRIPPEQRDRTSALETECTANVCALRRRSCVGGEGMSPSEQRERPFVDEASPGLQPAEGRGVGHAGLFLWFRALRCKIYGCVGRS